MTSGSQLKKFWRSLKHHTLALCIFYIGYKYLSTKNAKINSSLIKVENLLHARNELGREIFSLNEELLLV